MKERIYENGIDEYPKKFVVKQLMTLHEDDLVALRDALDADLDRVLRAMKFKHEIRDIMKKAEEDV